MAVAQRERAGPFADLWMRRRAELSHDRLRNRFLPRLHACIALHQPGTEASPDLMDALHAALDEWPAIDDELVELLDEIRDLSPAHLAASISSCFPPNTGALIRDATITLWEFRHRIPSLVEELHAARAATSQHLARWLVDRTAESLRDVAHHCERLTYTLSKFPDRVRL